MKKGLIFTFGMAIGTFIGICMSRAGFGNNSGSEFWGDEYIDIVKDSHGGFGNNSGSKFYSNTYIKNRFNVEQLKVATDNED